MSDNRRLPDFLCLGAPKCGTTWLHELLESHPNVFIPSELKEVHFFDQRFEKGLDWYSGFFEDAIGDQRVVGEITPNYLYADPERIKTCESVKKMIIIYRDPVNRCISHYKFRMRLDNYNGTFDEFLVDYPESVDWSSYGKHFERYLKVFDPNQFLVLSFENATANIEATKKQLSEFLGLCVLRFPETAGQSKVNQSYKPRNRVLYKSAVRIAKWMGDFGLYRVRNWLKKSALTKKLLTNESQKFDVQIPEATRRELGERFVEDQKLFMSLIES